MALTANIWLMTNNTEVGTKVFLMPRNSPEIYRISPFMRMVDGTYTHDSSSFSVIRIRHINKSSS